jgi:hypothetical protein
MSAGPEITPTAATADADPWAARRLAILAELAEDALEIAHALKARIVETAEYVPDAVTAAVCADLGRTFDRASRAARMAIALRDRLIKDAPSAGQSQRTAANEARDQRAVRVLRIVGRAAEADGAGLTGREALDKRARERLFDPDITGDLLCRPIGELVAQICADIGVTPPWLDFSEEAWAQAEIAERPPGSPYAGWPELPPEDPELNLDDWDLDGDGEDDDEDPGDAPEQAPRAGPPPAASP